VTVRQPVGSTGEAAIATRGFPAGERVRVEVGANGQRSAVAWVETTLPVALKLNADRAGGEYGDKIDLRVSADQIPSDFGSPLTVRLAATDWRGQVFWQQQRQTADRPFTETFAFVIPDRGVDVYAYYVTVWLLSGDDPVGRAATVLYHYRPWDMRRQWQWSVWCDMYAYQPYRARAAMDLFADAGFNSIGFGYATARSVYWAERYGWRQYAELGGGYKMWNAPVVKWANDRQVRDAVRGQMSAMHRQFGNAWPSAALILGSLGEEPGFEKGWGRTYYWSQARAPAVAQTQFQRFLRERYGTVDRCASAWDQNLDKWSDATLEKRYALPGRKIDPMSVPEEEDLLAEESVAPLSDARCRDSADFFTWYFAKVAGFATEKLHELNPGARTFYSLAGPDIVTEIGEAASHHIYYPKEYQAAIAARERMRHDGMPAFSLIWNHFDIPAIQYAGHWSQVADQVTHTNLWLGFPLVFNDDLTHTRASMASKRFLARFQPVSPLLARATVAVSGVALLDGKFVTRKGRSRQAAYAALAENGLPPAFVDADGLSDARLVFASEATHVGPSLALALRQYVESGGILVTTSGFALRTAYGSSHVAAPGEGLNEWLGFTYGAYLRTDVLGRGEAKNGGAFSTDADSGTLTGITMPSTPYAADLLGLASDIEVLGKLPDGTPALLSRRRGKGRVYHLNFLHREWGWSTLYAPARESLRRILGGIAARENITPFYFVECCSNVLPSGSGMPYWGTQLFMGRDGRTHYLVVHSDHRSPQLTGRVHWYADDWTMTDLMTGVDLSWTGTDERGSFRDVVLRPGQGRILRLTPAGQTPETMLAVDKPATAPRDRATDLPPMLAPVLPRAWPSEQWPGIFLSDNEFIDTIEALRKVYTTGNTREMLSYYQFDGSVANRHALTRVLALQDWVQRVPALARAVTAGAIFMLTGEDMGVDPMTGLSVTLQRPRVLEALADLGRQPDARWYSASADGQALLLILGRGRMILDRTSIDSVGFFDADLKVWREKWWALRAPLLRDSDASDYAPATTPDLVPVPNVTVQDLRDWLIGTVHLRRDLAVYHFAGLRASAEFVRPLLPAVQHQSVTVAIPQRCRIKDVALTVRAESNPGFSNVGFESATDTGYPTGMRGTHGGSAVVVADVRHGGSHSLRLTPKRGASGPLTLVVPLALGKRDVNLCGQTYKLGMWIKAHELQTMDLRVRTMRWGKPIGWEHDIWVPLGSAAGGTHDWRFFEWSCVMPDTRANYMDIHIRVYGGNDTVVWLDDAQGTPLHGQVTIGVGNEPGEVVKLNVSAGVDTIVTDGLVELFQQYLGKAPVDENGMCTIPVYASTECPARVTLSAPRITLFSRKPRVSQPER